MNEDPIGLTLPLKPRTSVGVLQHLLSLLLARLVDACCVGSGSPGLFRVP